MTLRPFACTSATLLPLLLLACGPLPDDDASAAQGMNPDTPVDGLPIDDESGPFEEDDDAYLDEPNYDDDSPADDEAPPADDDSSADDEAPPADAPETASAQAGASFEGEMTFTTANIGRDYNTRGFVENVFDKVGDVIGPKTGPKFIGWQEIGEADPCGGACEIESLRARFRAAANWETRRPQGTRPNGTQERVKVPVTSKGANDNLSVHAVFASPALAGISPTRFVTVAHSPLRNVSFINTHFIAGAWSCKSQAAQRREYWRRAWNVLKAEVAAERQRGRNVVVTGDLNRPRGENNCNPAWDPTSLHPRAKIVGGVGIDYVFAVPAAGYNFVVSTRADGTKKRGSITLGIDGHKAHWVSGRFKSQ